MTKKPARTTELDHVYMLRLEALAAALERASEDAIPLELLQDMRRLILEDPYDVLCQGLTS